MAPVHSREQATFRGVTPSSDSGPATSCAISLAFKNFILWTYLQGRNREAENRHLDTAGHGGGTGGQNELGEQRGYICLYILLCVKQVTSGRLLYNTGSAQCSVMIKMDKMWMDGRLKGGIYIYIHTADSLHCTAETNKTLLSNYTPIKINNLILASVKNGDHPTMQLVSLHSHHHWLL